VGNEFKKKTLSILIVACTQLLTAWGAAEKPNLVFILADDFGFGEFYTKMKMFAGIPR
jgi:hypothetical protein